MDSATELRERVRAARDCGVVHLEVRSRPELSDAATDPRAAADALARLVGLRPLGAAWRELSREAARAALVAVLHRDMAYGAELMSEAGATALADEFLGWFGNAARYYTNGTFPPRTAYESGGWAGSWDPITDATFDTGVVAVSDAGAGLLWVEDED